MEEKNNPDNAATDALGQEVSEMVDIMIAKIILCRKKKHYTQKQLAELSGVPEVTIARMESFNPNYCLPRIDTILRLAIVLGINLQFDYNPNNDFHLPKVELST